MIDGFFMGKDSGNLDRLGFYFEEMEEEETIFLIVFINNIIIDYAVFADFTFAAINSIYSSLLMLLYFAFLPFFYLSTSSSFLFEILLCTPP